jgi:hypothetical protein
LECLWRDASRAGNYDVHAPLFAKDRGGSGGLLHVLTAGHFRGLLGLTDGRGDDLVYLFLARQVSPPV